MKITREEALRYHQDPRPGKLEIRVTKSCETQWDLSLAYTPGVAHPCREIERDPDLAYEYTIKGNLVAVITNGTAVLGLGDIGPLAGKPVMEGKGVLFKRFAGVDAIDIEVDTHDPDEFIHIVEKIAATFGGINLEDIKAPECFYIEEQLRERLDIPVFHDDQHGTAIISGAALLNALEISGKSIGDIRLVVSGAGASAMACVKHYIRLGVQPENVIMCDSKGVIHVDRTDLNPFKREFARDVPARTLAEALEGADMFLGLSVANIVTPEMVRRMADNPIIFAMANPDPEIPYEKAKEARPDAIVATGRSDYPNQVNNVLGFPFIFRGALDVRARKITEEMKMAATKALAALAKEPVPDVVARAYGVGFLNFGPDYLIPKPLDPRVLYWEAPAVAQAAMECGVARRPVDIDEYRERLREQVEAGGHVTYVVMQAARRDPKRVVFPEGEDERIIRAAYQVEREGYARPILLGREDLIAQRIHALQFADFHPTVVDPSTDPRRERYARKLYDLRQRKGMVYSQAYYAVVHPNVFGSLMVLFGDADGMLTGLTTEYDDAIRPVLQVIKSPEGLLAAGMHIVTVRGEVFFLADTTININPTAEQLATIAELVVNFAERLGIEPRVAFLSFSNFGAVREPEARKVARAAELFHERRPEVMADGEMQADVALTPEIMNEFYPFSRLRGRANVLICPDLNSANIGYKFLAQLSEGAILGPILLGVRAAAHAVARSATVDDLVRMTALVSFDAQCKESGGGEPYAASP